jgi:hypothetical protein
MSIKSTSISSARQQSVQSKSAGFIFVGNAYAATGTAITQSTDIKRYVVVPGQVETIQTISGGEVGDAPTITSIVVTDENWVPTGLNVIDNLTGGYIEINGTGFDLGTIVYLNGQSITTIFVNSNLLRVTVPPSAVGTYNLMIFNSTGTGVIYLNLNFSSAPEFITPAGLLGTTFELEPLSYIIEANADSPIVYSIQSGELPSNVFFQSNGLLSGNGPAVLNDTQYSFIVLAQDQENQQTSRSFTFSIRGDVITWINPDESFTYTYPTGFDITDFGGSNIVLNAQAVSGQTISFSVNSLPSGLSFTGNTISGTPTQQQTIVSLLTATSAITNKTNNLIATFQIKNPFEITNYVPYFANVYALGSFSCGNHFMSPNGRNYFVANTTRNTIMQYNLQANNLATMTYVSELPIQANGTSTSLPQAVTLSNDGTKMFVAADPNTPWINEYVLSEPWNINSAVFVSNITTSPANSVGIDGVYFANAGQRMYSLFNSVLYEWSLSTNWQVNTASYTNRSLTLPSLSYSGIVSEDGQFLFSANNTTIVKRSLTVPYQINQSTIIQTTNIKSTGFSATNRYMQLSIDGKKLYFIVDPINYPTVFNEELTDPYNLSSISVNRIGGLYKFQTFGIYIKSDGTRLWTVDVVTNVVTEFVLPVPYEVGPTMTTQSTFSAGSVGTRGISFKDDGTKLYLIVGAAGYSVIEYSLSTPWQVNTAVQIGSIGMPLNSEDLVFRSDGARMYITGSGRDAIDEYHLSTPWQVNTAVQRGTYSVSSFDGAPSALFLDPAGTNVFFTGFGSDKVHQLNLSTAWQINTATYFGNISVENYETAPQALTFDTLGIRMYLGGQIADFIRQYKIG